MSEDHAEKLIRFLQSSLAPQWTDACRHAEALIAERDAAVARADAEQLRRELAEEHEALVRYEHVVSVREEVTARQRAEEQRDRARAWINTVKHRCFCGTDLNGEPVTGCNCGRDAALADEPPGEKP